MRIERIVAAIVWTTMIFFAGCGDSSIPKGNVTEAEKIAEQIPSAVKVRWIVACTESAAA